MPTMQLPGPVRDFVAAARVGHLATVDGRGRPHVVPFCFVLEGDIAYSVLDEKPKTVPVEELRRVKNILARPDVQFVVDVYDEDWSCLAFVQLRGRARLLTTGEEHSRALSVLRDKYPQYVAMKLEVRPVIAIDLAGYVAWGPGLPD